MNNQRQQKKMAAEELVRTQVLNLDEVRKVARYEKKTSKKPALICGILGACMIMIGAGTQGIIAMSNRNIANNSKQNDVVERKDIDIKNETQSLIPSTLSCGLSSQGNANGTNNEFYMVFHFLDNKLKSESKAFLLDRIAGNELGDASMRNLYVAYQTFESSLVNINGYQIKTAPRGDFGFEVDTEIDLTKLNLNELPSNVQLNAQIKVDFPLNTDYEKVKSTAEISGFTCQ